MLKISGVILCIAGCCGYGMLKIASWNRALQELNQWILLFQKMKSHIQYQRDTLEEICVQMDQDIYGIGGKHTAEAGKASRQQRNRGFDEVWQNQMSDWKKESYLPKRIQDSICHFPDYIGEQDPELQISFLDLYLSSLIKEKNTLEGQIQEKKKPVMAMSLSGGIVISLLLL